MGATVQRKSSPENRIADGKYLEGVHIKRWTVTSKELNISLSAFV
ncbi:mCG1038140 [Mus musculus]|nr:mCG1038140 [Mus musculus]